MAFERAAEAAARAAEQGEIEEEEDTGTVHNPKFKNPFGNSALFSE